MNLQQLPFDITTLQQGYRSGDFTPAEVVDEALRRIAESGDNPIWITVLDRQRLQGYLQRLGDRSPDELPLFGIPFAIKDNIDLAGVETSAGCPGYAYTPTESATVVERLLDAGAIPLGKTNLDQFATGLVGTRSPYGACANAFNPAFISGGSSSGSAVSLALGQVSFSLGTDTAGSGRVPAAFNNLLGLKPSKGLLSTSGVVPACRSLDCVSIFTFASGDAERVFSVAEGFDPGDPYSRSAVQPRELLPQRFRFGVPKPEQLEFFGDAESEEQFKKAVTQLRELGGEAVEIDFAPFADAARLLYEGPWVTERYLAIKEFLEQSPEQLLAVTRQIIEGGSKPSAADAFAAQYRLAELKRISDRAWQEVDLLITPTAGTHYTIAQLEADPIALNSNLGYYTNFMNLLDLSAVAMPTGFRDNGLPYGVTAVAPAFHDRKLLQLASRLEAATALPMGATGHPLPQQSDGADTAQTLTLAVCGAHLSGLPLNHQLTERGAVLQEQTQTSDHYRLYALAGGPPLRPGLIRDEENGSAIEVELWGIPQAEVGSFLAGIPAPLGLGKLELADGRWVTGFICEGYAVADATEITAMGGWRRYIEGSG